MKVRPAFELPREKQALRYRAIKLEWVTLLIVVINIGILYSVLGDSQTMRTAWIEDILTLVPPLAFLVAAHFEAKPPDEKNPYGYFRAIDIAYLCAALTLFAFGGYLFFENARTLIKGAHPSIGTIVVLGEQFWLGWLMIAALVVTAIPAVILGLLKLPVAHQLHDKVLYADAKMNKADWLTSISSVVGVGGIGLGFWWLDAAAAMIIAADITWDGIRNLKHVLEDLLDALPRQVESDREENLPEQVRQVLQQLDWVADVTVRMREEGHVFSGEAMVVPQGCTEVDDLLQRLEKARQEILALDWRLYDFHIVLVSPGRC